MLQSACCLKQQIGMIIAASVLGLFGTASAEDITLIHFNNPSGQESSGASLFPTVANNGISIGITVEEREPSSLGTWYSKSALEDYDFKFRDKATTEKADTLDALKAAMDEFEVLQGVKETFEGTEEKFESYIKKFMLKGELSFDQKDKAASPGKDNTPKLRGKTSTFFHKLFVPDRVEWNLDASLSNRGVGAEVNLGEYLRVKGDVGEDTEAFIMFKIKF